MTTRLLPRLATVLLATAATLAAAGASAAEGVVKKINADKQTIRIHHQGVTNLDMPAMPMAFQVKSPAMLTSVKEGDEVTFSAEKIDGRYVITAIQRR